MEWNGTHENALKNNKFGIFATKQTVRTMHLLDGFFLGKLTESERRELKEKHLKRNERY